MGSLPWTLCQLWPPVSISVLTRASLSCHVRWLMLLSWWSLIQSDVESNRRNAIFLNSVLKLNHALGVGRSRVQFPLKLLDCDCLRDHQELSVSSGLPYFFSQNPCKHFSIVALRRICYLDLLLRIGHSNLRYICFANFENKTVGNLNFVCSHSWNTLVSFEVKGYMWFEDLSSR